MKISHPAFELQSPIELPADEVHLWRVDLAAVAPAEQRWKQILSDDERERASRFRFSREREYYTATRALLRTIIAGYAVCDPKQLVFSYSDKGKPFLEKSSVEKFTSDGTTRSPDSTTQIEFNVSHSGETALLAFAQGRALGVDVERVRENFDCEAVARRFFSEHEVRQLDALAPPEKPSGFFRCWTRKEAYIKAVGTGLSLPLNQFDVSLKPGDGNALLATRPNRSEAARWSLRDIPLGDGYVAALCAEGDGWLLKM